MRAGAVQVVEDGGVGIVCFFERVGENGEAETLPDGGRRIAEQVAEESVLLLAENEVHRPAAANVRAG